MTKFLPPDTKVRFHSLPPNCLLNDKTGTIIGLSSTNHPPPYVYIVLLDEPNGVNEYKAISITEACFTPL